MAEVRRTRNQNLLFFSLLILIARPARLQTPVLIESWEGRSVFAESLTVSVRINPEVAHNAVTVVLDLPGNPSALVGVAVQLEDGSWTYTVDLRGRSLPAFAQITLSFVVALPAGGTLESESFDFLYADTRFAWHTRERDPFRLHWYEGDEAFAQAALDSAAAGLERIEAVLEVQNREPVDIYLYSSLTDYQIASGLPGQTWAGGHTDPAAGTILVSVPPGEESSLDGERKLPHEIAHVMLYRLTGSGYANLPAWLNEGFASTMETYPNPDYLAAVSAAYESGRLFETADLCVPFSAEPDQVFLAYAQSTAMTRYIEQVYGTAGLLAAIRSYAAGAACEIGTEIEPIRLSLAALGQNWLVSFETDSPPRPVAQVIDLPALALLLASLLGPALVLLGGLSRRGSS